MIPDHREKRTEIMIFYTGSYTLEGSPALHPKGQGIGCLELDQASGKVKLLHYTEQRNPSYLTISDDQNYLYAVEEMTESQKPKVFSYKINNDGKLTLINSQDLTGDYACHLVIIQDRLVIANYMTGNALSFPILKNGGLGPCHQIIQHKGKGPDVERQEGPHAHMVYAYKRNHLFLVDLGIDTAKAYQLNSKTINWKAIPELDIKIKLGAGARHMAMDASESFAFVLSELSGEIFVLEKQKIGFKQIQSISIVPENYNGNFGGAALRIHPNGKFLYASNRGPDTISIFGIDEHSKKLSLIANQSTEGKAPRDFNIDPSGKWLIAANQDSNTLVVFKINQERGTLGQVSTINVGTPTNIVLSVEKFSM